MKTKAVAIWSVTIVIGLLFATAAAEAQKPARDPIDSPKSVIGPRNPLLAQGADAMLNGDYEEGVELTRKGLAVAQGRQEHKTGLTNLCAGYYMLRQLESALDACNEVVELDPNFWRAYNNRALVLLEMGRYEESAADVDKGIELRPYAKKLQLTRAKLLDVTNPVEPTVEIDDRRNAANDGADGDGI
jgi:tetratricopeptide (TPR) repeat protein